MDIFIKPKFHHKDCYNIGINNYLVGKYGKHILQFFKTDFPDLEFEISTDSTKILLQKYKHGLLDHIIYYHLDPSITGGRLISNRKLVFVFHKDDYMRVNGNFHEIGKLNKPIYLTNNSISTIYFPVFEHVKFIFESNKIQIVNNVSLIKDLITFNKGFTILPEAVYDRELKQHGLYKIDLPEEYANLPILNDYRDKNSTFIDISKKLEEVLINT